MDANIQKKIIEENEPPRSKLRGIKDLFTENLEASFGELYPKEIKNLDSFQLSEVLDFVDFLYQKRKIKTPAPDAIDSIWGKYRKSLSGSGEFARRKLDEIKKR